jgi:hypothetical protein
MGIAPPRSSRTFKLMDGLRSLLLDVSSSGTPWEPGYPCERFAVHGPLVGDDPDASSARKIDPPDLADNVVQGEALRINLPDQEIEEERTVSLRCWPETDPSGLGRLLRVGVVASCVVATPVSAKSSARSSLRRAIQMNPSSSTAKSRYRDPVISRQPAKCRPSLQGPFSWRA